MYRNEKRLRERFPALTHDVLWATIEAELGPGEAFLDDYDEQWWPRLQSLCIALSKRLGLPFGPAVCAGCSRPWPELGDEPDGDCCPICQTEQEAREQARARLESMSPEERAARQSMIRLFTAGLFRRDVQ